MHLTTYVCKNYANNLSTFVYTNKMFKLSYTYYKFIDYSFNMQSTKGG